MRWIPIVALALGLTGCNQTLQNIDASVRKYGPLIGKDLVLIGDILVQAECSPALSASSATAVNVLNIVAPTSGAASTVEGLLQTNMQVTAQLCPLIGAIRTQVGRVPNGRPTQSIPVVR